MKKIALILALMMTCLSVFTACGEEKSSGGISIDASAGANNSDTQIVSGLLDESYTLPTNITKIVSLSPAASMILDGLGAASKLVAVDAVSAEYVSVSATTTAADAAALAPEVIFVDEADADALGDTDIPVFKIPTAESSDAVKKLIRLCAKVTGTSSDALVNNLTNAITAAQLGSAAYSDKLSVYVDLGDNTVGSGTYITEILYASGLENICTAEGYTTMTDDEIISANPEFIFTVGDVNDYLENAAYAEVSAVVNGYVYSVDEKSICYASQYIGDAVSSMYNEITETRGDE